jgi:hypothetical protein
MIEYEDHQHKYKRGNMQHKIFKVVILIFVAVFFYLIFSFIKIEFFNSSDTNITDYSFKINSEKYKYLHKIDQKFYNSIKECDIENFYINHIAINMPCFIKKENSELTSLLARAKNIINELSEKAKVENSEQNLQGVYNGIGSLSFTNILDFPNLFLSNSYIEGLPKLTSNNYIMLQLEGQRKFYLSPCSEINSLEPFRINSDNKSFIKFNKIYSKKDLSLEPNDSKVTVLSVNLNEGDALFIPSYFFFQDKLEVGEKDKILIFEYESGNRVLNTMFKVLFDDGDLD